MAFLIAFVLAIISILPTPPFAQYFCMCMPYLIVAAVCATSGYVSGLRAAWPKQIAMLACAAILVISSPPPFQAFDGILSPATTLAVPILPPMLRTGLWTRLPQSPRRSTKWWRHTRRLPASGLAHSFASKADPYPGFENDASPAYSRGGSRLDQKAKYHILGDRSEIESDFAAHTPRMVVLANRDLCYVASRASLA